ncbi:gamma-butyrobetaine dioxygenase-like [Ciona intestinalis]
MLVSKVLISEVQVSLDGKICEVKWSDDHISRFHAKWLRFNCHCSQCYPEFSGIYKVDFPQFPDDTKLTEASIGDNALLTKHSWDIMENHTTTQPFEWLRSFCYCDTCLSSLVRSRDIISTHFENTKVQQDIPTIDYSEMKDNDVGLYSMLQKFMESGFCKITNVPCEDKMVLQFARRFGPIRETLYGEMFDVLPHNSINVAYTCKGIPLHMDQQNYEYTPGIQLLHALRFDNEVIGGVSTLLDMFQVAEIFRKESPEDFKTFLEVPACFNTIDYKRKEVPIYLEVQKHHIVLDYYDKIVAVNWHAGFASTLRIKEKDVERYYKAHRKFSMIMQREKLVGRFRFRLRTGDLVFFNNRRMTHARDGFTNNGGIRHLQGCYLNLDECKSKYMILANKLGLEVTPPKVGNASSI